MFWFNTPDTFQRTGDGLGTVQHMVRKHGVMLYGMNRPSYT